MRSARLVVVTAATLIVLVGGTTALALASTHVPNPATPAATTAGSATGAPTASPLGGLAPGSTSPTSGVGAPARGEAAPCELSADEAAAVALAHVGSGHVGEIEREFEHGRREWKVEIRDGGREHDVRVDAVTGAVTRSGVDR